MYKTIEIRYREYRDLTHEMTLYARTGWKTIQVLETFQAYGSKKSTAIVLMYNGSQLNAVGDLKTELST